MKKNIILVLLFFNFITTAQSSDEVFSKYREKVFESKYLEIHNLLQKSLFNIKCHSTPDKLDKKRCSFKELCETLINRDDEPYLYINKHGEKIPNFRLQKLIESTNNCYQQISGSMNIENSSLMNKSQITRKEMIKEVIKIKQVEAFKDFEKSVFQQAIESKDFNEVKKLEAKEVNLDNLPKEIQKDYKKSLKIISAGKEKYDDWITFKTKKNREDIFEIFKRVQKGILDILDNKINKKNKKRIEEMKKRISTIQFKLDLSDPLCTRPTASYSPLSHSFTLCPQITSMPVNAVMTVVAHELGHSIDPCIMSYDLLKTNNEYTIDNPGFESNDEARISDGIPLSDYPFLGVVKCLNRKKSLGANGFNKPSEYLEINKELKGLPRSSLTYKTLTNRKKEVRKLGNTHGACTYIDYDSQLQEAFSDWLSAEFVGAEVEKTEGVDKLERAYEAGTPLLARSCSRPVGELSTKAVDFIIEMGCYQPDGIEATTENYLKEIDGHIEGSEDEHNYDGDRLEKVYASHPEVAKALGCSKEMSRYCK